MLKIKLNREEIEFFINHNFREIIILTILIACLLGLFISIMLIVNSNTEKDGPLTPAKQVDRERPAGDLYKEYLVEKIYTYPPLNNLDLSSDYIDFMPLKKMTQPGIEIIQADFDVYIEKSLDDACLFNFEKRNQQNNIQIQ